MSLNFAKALASLTLVTLVGATSFSGGARADTLSRVDPGLRIATCTFEMASEYVSPSSLIRTYLGLGVASAFLHDIDAARAGFEQAERLEPNDCKTRMLGALLAGISAGVQKVDVLRDILRADVGDQ
jgi:hypothetical protein